MLLLAAAAMVWARYFPAAAGFLERVGIATASVEPEAAGRAAAGPRGGRAPVVIGVEVAEAAINDSVSAIGDGRAARSVSVTPYVSGRVVAVEVASGDYVKAGAPLVRLDAEAEEIALDRARLTLEDARATLARDEALVRSQAVSESQLRTAQLALDQAELAVRDAELALEHRVIRAPFDGWVGILGVDVGDQVTSATEVTTLDDRSHILVDFRVPERFVGQVKVGAPVSARPLARPGLDARGRGGDGRQPDQRRHPHAPGPRQPREQRGSAARRHGLLDRHALSRRDLRGGRPAGDPVERRRGLCLDRRRRPGEAGAGAHRPAQQRRGAGGGGACARLRGGDPRRAAAARGPPLPVRGGRAAGDRGRAADEPAAARRPRGRPGPDAWRRGRTPAARRRGFTALFVRRPILAVVLNSLIVIAGLAALLGIEVRELPDVDRPVITVTTDYDGAAPETVDRELTSVIEGAMGRDLGGQRHLVALVLRTEPGDGRVHRRHRPQRRGLGRARLDRARARTSCRTTPRSRASSRPTPTPRRSSVSASPPRPCRWRA